MSEHELVLMEGRKSDPFARTLSQHLGLPLCPVKFIEFLDDGGPRSGETKVEIRRNIRGRDVCILWTIGHTNYELVQVLQLIDAARLSGGAHHIRLIVPEYPCARQDKTHERRESLSSRLVARLLETAGLDSVLTMDLHSDQIEGHFRIPLDHLRTRPIWTDYICRRYRQWMDDCGAAPEGGDLVLGVPDAGRARAVRELSDSVAKWLRESDQRIKIKLAHHDKFRRWEVPGEVASHGLLGDVKDRIVWFTDDLLSSGGTLFGAAHSAKLAGAAHVVCSITHPHGFDKKNKPFAQALAESDIDELIVTDTHPRFVERVKQDPELAKRITILSLTPMFAGAIQQLRRGDTIKEMMRDLEDFSSLYTVLHEATGDTRPGMCLK